MSWINQYLSLHRFKEKKMSVIYFLHSTVTLELLLYKEQQNLLAEFCEKVDNKIIHILLSSNIRQR